MHSASFLVGYDYWQTKMRRHRSMETRLAVLQHNALHTQCTLVLVADQSETHHEWRSHLASAHLASAPQRMQMQTVTWTVLQGQ